MRVSVRRGWEQTEKIRIWFRQPVAGVARKSAKATCRDPLGGCGAARQAPSLALAEDPLEEQGLEGLALLHVGQVGALLEHVHLAPG